MYNFVKIKNQLSKIEVETVKDRVLFFTYSFTYSQLRVSVTGGSKEN